MYDKLLNPLRANSVPQAQDNPGLQIHSVKIPFSAPDLCVESPVGTRWGWSEGKRWWKRCRQLVSWCSTPLLSSLGVSSPPEENWSLEEKRDPKNERL